MTSIYKGGLNFQTGNCKPIEKRKSVKNITPEKDIQEAFIAWRNMFKRQHPVLNSIFAVPNGIWTFRAIAIAQVKQGLTAGIPDIIVLAPSFDARYHALTIEFKTEIGELSEDQEYFLKFFAERG